MPKFTKIMPTNKNIYLNPKQDAFLYAKQKTKCWIGGRGSGKTVNCGDHVYDFHLNLAGHKGYLLGKTFGQVYDKFLPEILNRLSDYGLKEVTDNRTPGHYIVCKQPPSYFKRPKKMPRRYDTTVFFWTGFCLELLSFDRPDVSRGGSYDVGIIDEAALIKKDKFNKAISPLLRGKVTKWDHPQRFSQLLYTSRSWTTWGRWVEQDFKKLAADHPEKYYYMETSALDNKPVLGEGYFFHQKNMLTPHEYDVEILNNPITGIPNGYYPYLSDERHLYSVSNDYSMNSNNLWIKTKDGDLDPEKPIEPSFDFNAAFTSAVIFQDYKEDYNEYRGINEFWIKHESIEKLVDKICDYYKDHPTKVANIYGGKDGISTLKLVGEQDYYHMIMRRFKHNGWHTFLKVDINWSDAYHKIKYEVISSCMQGNDLSLASVKFNMDNCSHTFKSMKNAPIKGEFKKDKSSESDAELPQELATHLSDCVDNYLVPKLKSQLVQSQGGSMSVTSG